MEKKNISEEKTMKKRKKICARCGNKLWNRFFYVKGDGSLSTYCKCCERAIKKEKYAKNDKIPDGIRYYSEKNRVMVKNGLSVRIFWSKDMIDMLIRDFPHTLNSELSGYIGVSPRSIVRKARELGLVKDAKWLSGIWDERRLMAHASSKRKGYPGAFRPGNEIGKEYRFKKNIKSKQMKVKFKKLNGEAIIPRKATGGSAAYDVYIPDDISVTSGRQIIPLGFSMEIPSGYEAKIEPRSGFSSKGMEGLSGSKDGRFDADVIVGKIDSDYRGNIGVIINNRSPFEFLLKKNTRIAQMTFYKAEVAEFVETDTLSDSERGSGGFGSTGNS